MPSVPSRARTVSTSTRPATQEGAPPRTTSEAALGEVRRAGGRAEAAPTAEHGAQRDAFRVSGPV